LDPVGADREADTVKMEDTNMSVISKDSGFISFKVMFVLLLLFIVIHIGLKVIPMYIDAEAMKDEMSAKAGFAQTMKDEEILRDLVKRAKELSLPLGPDDFKLLRDDESRRMKISTAWDVEIHFFYDIYPPFTDRTFHFRPIVEQAYVRRF
jgi:hypothetical protein